MWRQTWAALTLALSAHLFQAQAQGVTTYLESSGTELRPRSNAGLSVQSDRLSMRADFALQAQQVATLIDALEPRPSGSTEVVPNLRSAFTLAENLNLETGVSFADWNSKSATTFDTRLRYKKSLHAFFDELDGSIWRSPEGRTNQRLRLGFHENLGDGDLGPLTVTGTAIFEATQTATATLIAQSNYSHKVGIETKVAGLMPSFLGADHAVGFKVEKTVGTRPESANTLTYDQSWAPSPWTQLGLNWRFLRQRYSAADGFAPSLDFTWRSKF